MNRVAAALAAAREELDLAGAATALVGGLAVSTRTEPRFTRDVDLAVSVTSDREAEAIVHGLVSRGTGILAVVEQEGRGRLATVRLLPPGEGTAGVVVDLLFASSGIETEIVAAAEPLEVFPGLTAPVAGIGHLLACKILSVNERRPQDSADIAALVRAATEADLDTARAAVRLITVRGFDRGRTLPADLDEAIRRLR